MHRYPTVSKKAAQIPKIAQHFCMGIQSRTVTYRMWQVLFGVTPFRGSDTQDTFHRIVNVDVSFNHPLTQGKPKVSPPAQNSSSTVDDIKLSPRGRQNRLLSHRGSSSHRGLASQVS